MRKINVEEINSAGVYLSEPQSFHVDGGVMTHSWISNNG